MFANSQASFRLFKLVYPSRSLTNPLRIFSRSKDTLFGRSFHVVYQLTNGTSEQNCASLGRTSQNDLLSGLYGHSWTPQFFVWSYPPFPGQFIGIFCHENLQIQFDTHDSLAASLTQWPGSHVGWQAANSRVSRQWLVTWWSCREWFSSLGR